MPREKVEVLAPVPRPVAQPHPEHDVRGHRAAGRGRVAPSPRPSRLPPPRRAPRRAAALRRRLRRRRRGRPEQGGEQRSPGSIEGACPFPQPRRAVFRQPSTAGGVRLHRGTAITTRSAALPVNGRVSARRRPLAAPRVPDLGSGPRFPRRPRHVQRLHSRAHHPVPRRQGGRRRRWRAWSSGTSPRAATASSRSAPPARPRPSATRSTSTSSSSSSRPPPAASR